MAIIEMLLILLSKRVQVQTFAKSAYTKAAYYVTKMHTTFNIMLTVSA